ncbi:bifunctional 3-(3-hydroxy-phenyl)propionate/3-hydroxycinnamic acid hydroxylase [Klenkia terrae]|uniref:Bifunctional 3-(3-hydroxy-phenyl)propionate/3-hydroxycinnamic acid hydroxylase n=1 Tax=Klenkia terrae TaxID=1052259 RepID=A0ABU8EDI6_9ACTN
MSALSAEVAVVGFGPVGKLLAIQLGRRGHDVVVVDRQEAGYPLPRAVTHDSEFARVLQSVGLAPDTIPEVTEPYDDRYVWRNGEGRTLVEVDWTGHGESGWFNTYFFHQPSLEDALDRVVAGLPTVRVLRGQEAVALDQDDDGVTLTLRDTAGATRPLRAGWVVGADGANSRVRRWAGLDWQDEGYFHDWLVVDVRPQPHLRFPHVAEQTCDVARPATMVPGGPGRRRWEFMRLPHETREQLDRTESAWELLASFGLGPADAELERHSVYTFQAGWATRWRAGRVLLAGDAAHLMPPFAGQGLGAGVRDAANLAWKLSAVLRGVAGDELLDGYGTERLPHVQTFVRFSVELGQVICISDPAEAAARDARMTAAWDAGMAPPAPPRPALGPGAHTGPAGGTLSRQGRVRVGGGPATLLDDVLGGPGVLLARDAGALGSVDAAPLADLGIRLAALGGAAPGVLTVDDVEGSYAGWFDQLGVDVVLVRPDGWLYGAGDDAAALADGLLAAVRSPAPVG